VWSKSLASVACVALPLSLALSMALSLALSIVSCARFGGDETVGGGRTLRVGVTPSYPPVVFKDDKGELTGIEPELARGAAQDLERKVEFVELPWDSLIPALGQGQIDVIMSGMSVTAEREQQVLFVTPYMRVGQLALIRVADLARFGRPESLRTPGTRVGYVRETTGQDFVTQKLPAAESYAFASVEDGVRNLRASRIDFFIHDAPTIWRITLSPLERDLMGLYQFYTEEYLAWAVAPGNTALKQELDQLLDTWKADGKVDRLVNRWIPVRVEVQP